jgi:hypothetical protein
MRVVWYVSKEEDFVTLIPELVKPGPSVDRGLGLPWDCDVVRKLLLFPFSRVKDESAE